MPFCVSDTSLDFEECFVSLSEGVLLWTSSFTWWDRFHSERSCASNIPSCI